MRITVWTRGQRLEFLFMTCRMAGLAIALAMVTITGQAQQTSSGPDSWTRLPGTADLAVECLGLVPGGGQGILAATYHTGLQRTTNGGTTWTKVLTAAVSTLAVAPSSPADIYAGTWGDGVFRSADGGATWVGSSSGLVADDVYALAVDPANASIVLAGTEIGVFLSTDAGQTWHSSSTGLMGRSVYSLATSGTVWIAGTDAGAARSTDGGVHWTPASAGPVVGQVFALATGSDGSVWAGTERGVARSQDEGQTWSSVSNGLPAAAVHSVAVSVSQATRAYAGTAHGVYLTTSTGAYWSSHSQGLTDWALQVKSLVLSREMDPQLVFVGTGAGIWHRETGVTPTPTSSPTCSATPPVTGTHTATPVFSPTSTRVAGTWPLALPIVVRASDLRPPATPAPTPTPTSTPVGLLMFDDFDDPGSDWYVGEIAVARFRYVDGEYEIVILPDSGGTWVSAPGVRCQDCRLEVKGRMESEGMAAYGMVFGLTNSGDYYTFNVSHNQMYRLGKVVTGTWQDLVPWTKSEEIRPGRENNQLKVVRDGSDIEMYVNGYHLATVADDSLIGRLRVGLYARAWNHPGFVTRFDNFSLYSSDVASTVVGKVNSQTSRAP